MLRSKSITPILCFVAFLISSTLAAWSSPTSGFLDRASTYTNTATFQPPRSSLELVVLRNTPVEPEGFTLALFSSDGTSNSGTYAVDAKGFVYVLQAQDANRLRVLARQAARLPETGEFRNAWILKAETTSQPIDRILIPKGLVLPAVPTADYETEFNEVSVQGFNYVERELYQRTKGRTLLPAPLWELTGLALEARISSEGATINEEMVAYVKGLIQNAF